MKDSNNKRASVSAKWPLKAIFYKPAHEGVVCAGRASSDAETIIQGDEMKFGDYLDAGKPVVAVVGATTTGKTTIADAIQERT